MSKQNGTKKDNRRQFHSFLIEAQEGGAISNVNPDFEEFNKTVFEKPENWQKFHSFLLEAQDGGAIGNINSDIEYYNKAFDLGKLEPEAVTPAPSGGGLGRAGGGLGLASQSLSQSQSGRALDQAPGVGGMIKLPSNLPKIRTDENVPGMERVQMEAADVERRKEADIAYEKKRKEDGISSEKRRKEEEIAAEKKRFEDPRSIGKAEAASQQIERFNKKILGEGDLTPKDLRVLQQSADLFSIPDVDEHFKNQATIMEERNAQLEAWAKQYSENASSEIGEKINTDPRASEIRSQMQAEYASRIAEISSPEFKKFQEDIIKDFNERSESEVSALQMEMQAEYDRRVSELPKDENYNANASAIEQEVMAEYEPRFNEISEGLNTELNQALQQKALEVQGGQEYLQAVSDIEAEVNAKYQPMFNELVAEYEAEYQGNFNRELERQVEKISAPKTKLLEESGVKSMLDAAFNRPDFDNLDATTKKDLLDKSFVATVKALRVKRGELSYDDILNLRAEFDAIYTQKAFIRKSGAPSLFLIKSAAEEQLPKLIEMRKGLYDAWNNGTSYENEEVPWGYILYGEEMAKAIEQVNIAIENLEEVIRMPEKSSGGTWRDFWGEFSAGDVYDYVPFVSSLNDIYQSLTIYEAATEERPTLIDGTKRENPIADYVLKSTSFLNTAESLNQENLNRAQRVGASLKETVPFIVEFAFTAGIGSAAAKAVKQLSTQVFKESLKRTSIKALSYSLEVTVASIAQTTANPQQYVNGVIERMTPQMQASFRDGELVSVLDENSADDFLDAFRKAYGETFGEFFTERLGAAGSKFKRYAVNKTAQTELGKRMMIGWYMSTRGLTVPQFMNKFKKGIGWNGFFEELGEEIVNIPLTNFLTGDRLIFEGLDMKNLGDITASVAIMTKGLSAPTMVATGISAITPDYVTVSYKDANGLAASERIRSSVWNKVKEAIATPETLGEFIQNELPKLKVEGEQRMLITQMLDKAFVDYKSKGSVPEGITIMAEATAPVDGLSVNFGLGGAVPEQPAEETPTAETPTAETAAAETETQIEEEVEPKQEIDEDISREGEEPTEVRPTRGAEERAVDEIETVEEVEQEAERTGVRVGRLAIDQMEIAPDVFQYKAADDAESGTNRAERIKDKRGFKDYLAGNILVWVDKNNEVGRGAGKVYVVDGHHRWDFAKREGVKNLNVSYLDAANVQEARFQAAEANIAIGRGTAIDAAKVYRANPDGMKGFNPASKVGRDGAMLAKLSEGLFNMVVQGKLPVNVGVIIGENIESQDLQEQFYDVIKNRKLTNAAIAVMAQDMAASPKKTEVVANLFGETEREVAQYAERAKFVAGVRGIIGRAKNLLKKTAKSKSFLEEFGNKIDAEKSGGASQEAAVAFVVFDRLRNTSPEVKALIDEGMQRIEAGENATKVKNDIARRVMDIAEDVFMGRGAEVEAKPEKAKPEPKAEPKPEPKAEPKPEPKAEPKPEPKAEKAEPKKQPKEDVTKEVEEIAKEAGVKATNIRTLYDINRKVWGLNRIKALTTAIIQDRMIGQMAKRAGISKRKMYERIEFRKASEKGLPQGVLLQVDAWHGSPYLFEKFLTEFIGKGEGAQAFGWGLYFTDLESIARNYADVLSKRNLRQMYENDSMSDELFSYLESLDFLGFDNEWQALSEFYKTSEEEFRQFYDLSESEYRRLKDLSLKGLRNVYKVSLFKGKTPDQYTWLEWDKPLTKKQKESIRQQIKEEYPNNELLQGMAKYELQDSSLVDGRDIYEGLSKLIRFAEKIEDGDKQASLFLLRAGIDGIKYPAESISRGATSDTARGFNYVVFDENAVSIEEVIKFQKDAVKARGAMMMQMDGQAVLYALTDPNVSTPLHEMAHVFEHYLTDAEKRSVLRWAGKKEWDTSVSEKFARGFEKYLAEGKSPIPSLQKIFGKFKEWLTNIYNGITGSDIDIELNQPMREIYASMLGEAAVKPKKAEVKSSKEAWGEVKDSIRDLFDTYKGGGILPNERAQAEAWFKVHQSLARYIAAKVREAIEAGLKYTKNDAIKDIRSNLQGVPNANKLTDNDISLAYTDAVAMSAGEKPRFESAQDVIDASNNTPNSVTALNEGRQSFEKQLANGLKDWIRRRWVQFNRLFPDPNYAFRQVLKKTGSLLDKTTPEKLVESYMIARSGYSAKARSFANKYFDSIYGKLSLRERQILDEFIFYTRIVEVHQARILRRAEVRELTALSQDPTISKKDREKYAERAKVLTELGLNDVQHGFIEVGGKKVPLTADMAADWLASFDSNHPEISNEIRSRAKKYFDANRELLKERYEAGLITEQEYENLESYDYMRRVFDGVTEDLFTEDVASVAGGMDALRGIKEGSADLRLARNTQALLTMNALATYKAAEQNKFMNVVADFLGSKVEPEMAGKMAEFEQRFKNENGRKPTKDEIREYRALVYPMFVHTPGTKLPDGYQLIDFKTDGKNKKLAVSNEIANTFLSDTGRTISVPKAARAILNWITLNKVLKAFAVGIAPAFAVADFFMNLHHFSFVSGPTRSFFANAIYFLSKITGIGVKSLAQKALNMNVKAVKGDTQFKKLSEDYIKHGGGFSGITNEFKTIASRSLYGKYRARKHLKFVKAVTATASFIVSISETSEMSMRVTVYDTEYKRLRASFIKDKGRNPNDREITDMKTTAAAIAASGIDFRQGGDISKFLDMVLVFFNVAVQAARVELNNVRTKPLDTMLKFTEFGGLVFGYYAYMLLQADEDEKKGILGYSGFGDYDKRNYLIIMSPWVVKKDGKDVRPGFRLKLPTILRISNRLALEAASAYRGKQAMADPDLTKDLSSIIYKGYFPDLGLMPPTAQAAIAYNANFDLFKMKKIYTDKEMKYKPEEMYDPEKTKKLYRDIGMALGLKPQQLQVSVEKVVTSNNFFWSTLIENPYYQFTGDSDDMKKLWSGYDRKANALNSIFGGIYKYPTQYNRSKALTEDKKLEEFSNEVDFVFTQAEREVDALSVNYREQGLSKGSGGEITEFGLRIAEAISGKKIINQLSIIEKDSGFKMKDKEAKVLAKQRQILSSSIRKFELISLKGFPKLEKLLDSDRVGVQKESYINEFEAEFESNKNNEMYKYLAYSFLGAEDYLGYTGDDFTLPIGDIQEVLDVIGRGEGSEDLAKRIIALQYIYNNE